MIGRQVRQCKISWNDLISGNSVLWRSHFKAGKPDGMPPCAVPAAKRM